MYFRYNEDSVKECSLQILLVLLDVGGGTVLEIARPSWRSSSHIERGGTCLCDALKEKGFHLPVTKIVHTT